MEEKKLKGTDILMLNYTVTEDVNYEISIQDLVEEFGIDLDVETVKELLEKYPTPEAIGEAIENNISTQNLADYSTYSDVESEILISCDTEE